MKFKDFFEKAYCINLDRRVDRWEEAKKEFESIGIDVKRVSAVDGKDIAIQTDIKPGAYGCKMSHLKTLTMAIKNDYNCIFISEDDVVFDDDFNTKFENVSPSIPSDWDFIYLGANPYTGNRFPVSDGLCKLTGGYSSHAILMKNTIFHRAIEYIHTSPYPIDVIYGILQEQSNAYITLPHLAFQRNGFSDIENSEVNYDFFRI